MQELEARDTAAQFSPANSGLISQSLDGGPLEREVRDAKQGADVRAREAFAHEAERDFAKAPAGEGLNPYGRNPDSTGEMGERLASAYADQRGRQYEGSGAAGNDGDVGAV